MILLALAAATAFGQPWGRFSRAPALAHTAEVVEIATRGMEDGRPRFVLRLTRTQLRAADTRWTTSTQCPAVRTVLARLHDLVPPRIAPPGSPDEATDLVLDGVGYDLTMPAAFGAAGAMVTLSSNMDTPLAHWIDDALAALAPCWTDGPPKS